MSELKADNTFVFGEECLAYKKSEADKYISGLEENHKMKVEQLLIEIAELKKQVHDYAQGLYVIQARAEKEARHDKYKRGLAMVRCCMADNHTLSQVTLNEITNHLQWLFNENFFVKWAARWSKIAEQFKEEAK